VLRTGRGCGPGYMDSQGLPGASEFARSLLVWLLQLLHGPTDTRTLFP